MSWNFSLGRNLGLLWSLSQLVIQSQWSLSGVQSADHFAWFLIISGRKVFLVSIIPCYLEFLLSLSLYIYIYMYIYIYSLINMKCCLYHILLFHFWTLLSMDFSVRIIQTSWVSWYIYLLVFICNHVIFFLFYNFIVIFFYINFTVFAWDLQKFCFSLTLHWIEYLGWFWATWYLYSIFLPALLYCFFQE